MTERKPPAATAYHFLWLVLDWLFPPACGGCNQPGERWCSPCQQASEKITGSICPACGLPLTGATDCPDCLAQRPTFTALRSWGVYGGPLRKAILRLKYGRDMGMGEALSKHLIELYNDLQWKVDLIVPVPLSSRRRKERGYNQAGLLALPLAAAAGASYPRGALARIRETHSQVHLGASARRHNVQNAFRANPSVVRGRTVLVIDDVTTTGSTISACAQALFQAGAANVFGMTLARSVLEADAQDAAQNQAAR